MTDIETVIAARDIAVAAVTTTAANVDLATQQADRAEVARDAAVAPTAGQMATVDADAGSAFRVQQDARLTATFVAQQRAETGLGTAIHFDRLDPTAGPPFQHVFRSFNNVPSGGVGRNNAMWWGWNGGKHAQDGSFEAGDAAAYMGFESSWYDPSDLTQGPEWYTGYISPDGTSVGIGDLRPYYWRVLNGTDNDPDKSVIVSSDIGNGPDGQFSVWGGIAADIGSGAPLFYITQGVSYFTNQLVAGSGVFSVQKSSGVGGATSIVNGSTGTYAELQFRINGDTQGGFLTTGGDTLSLTDTTGAIKANFTTAASQFLNQLIAGSGVFSVRNDVGAGGASAFIDGDAATYSELVFRLGGTKNHGFATSGANVLVVTDKDNTTRLAFNYGATTDAALLDVRSSLKVQGGVGFFNTTPIAKRGATPDATDLATAITLVNALKADLVAYGLKS